MDELTVSSPDSALQSDFELNKTYGRFVSYYVFYGLIRGPPIRVSHKEISKTSNDPYIRTLNVFLNNLSLLIDSKNGGQTTPSVAIEDKDGQLNYWIAANCEVKNDSIEQLEKILSSLEEVKNLSPLERKRIEDEICHQSIKFCRQKVKDYRGKLQRKINSIRRQGFSSASEISMQEKLHKLTPLSKDPLELCNQASVAARDTVMMRGLKQLRYHAKNGIHWLNSYHYIDRLASWRRAANAVVEATVFMPGLVYNPKVRRVDYPAAAPVLGDTIPLEVLVREFYPLLGYETALRHLNALRKHDAHLIQDIYEGKIEMTRGLKIHAESIMADHFECNELEFYRDHRYVGCSKPSCYACDLYLKHRKEPFEPRPCHGNVWAQWTPPSVMVRGQRSRLDSMQTVLEKMIESIKEDINKQIISPKLMGCQLADSLTYRTSTVS